MTLTENVSLPMMPEKRKDNEKNCTHQFHRCKKLRLRLNKIVNRNNPFGFKITKNLINTLTTYTKWKNIMLLKKKMDFLCIEIKFL